MEEEYLIVRGAREHNSPQNIDVQIPMEEETSYVVPAVITRVIRQRSSPRARLRYHLCRGAAALRGVAVAYARQFLGMMEKPDVDAIEGLSPAISIEQKTAGRNPRFTVGTVTEVYDYLRLLCARVGTPHCPKCERSARRQSASQIVDQVLALPEGTRIEVLASLVRGRKGEFRELFEEMVRKGFVRGRVDGELIRAAELRPSAARITTSRWWWIGSWFGATTGRGLPTPSRPRCALTEGVVEVDVQGEDEPVPQLFSEHYACPNCGISIPELEPRQFSFNSPYGACPECGGPRHASEPNAELVLGDPSISILEGVVLPGVFRAGTCAA